HKVDIFVSYSSKDKQLVQPLVQDITGIGHKVWFDQELTGGQVWWDKILENIRGCELCIFVLTPNSLDSFPCKLEYTYATAVHKRVLPVLLSDINFSLLPYLLSIIQVVDYRKRDQASLISLIKAFNNLPPFKALPELLPTPPNAPVSQLGMIKER